MKKYKLKQLSVEVTRRCNKRCAHCLNGDAQNITMSTKIIDRIFEDIADVKCIHFCGGESLLHTELIEYFIKKILDSSWTTKMVEVTTNGTICDSRIVDAFEAFCTHKSGNYASLRVSNDEFHDATEYEHAYKYYVPLVDEANKRIWQNSGKGGILLHYAVDSEQEHSLHYSGRAVKLIDSGNSQFHHGLNVDYKLSMNHRIEIMDDYIPRALQILANGNINIYKELSYDELDRLSFGNIVHDSISNLIEKHNSECLLLRSEAKRLHVSEYAKHLPDMALGELSIIKFNRMICDRVMELRKKARALFPLVPAQDIIDVLPFPEENKVMEMLYALYEKSPYYSPEALANIKRYIATPKRYIYIDALCRAVFSYLNNPSLPCKHPYGDFFGYVDGGTDNKDTALKLPEFSQLQMLNEKYMRNPEEICNSKLFSDDLNNVLDTMTVQEYEESQDMAIDFFMNVIMGRMRTE